MRALAVLLLWLTSFAALAQAPVSPARLGSTPSVSPDSLLWMNPAGEWVPIGFLDPDSGVFEPALAAGSVSSTDLAAGAAAANLGAFPDGQVLGNFAATGSAGVAASSFPAATASAGPFPDRDRNRIVNGDMRIDVANAGQAITPSVSSTYVVDMWRISFSQASKFSLQQNGASVTPPNGFSNYLRAYVSVPVTVGASDYFNLAQPIEGYNFADLGFGAAGAKAVGVSFYAESSVTGTFGGALCNAAADRCYPFSFVIGAANAWTRYAIVIPGDTSGTWVGATNAQAAALKFGLGAGSSYEAATGAWTDTHSVQPTGAVNLVATNGATFDLTGVQLEPLQVTPFERRSFAVELNYARRYYECSYDLGVKPGTANTSSNVGASAFYFIPPATGVYGGGAGVFFKAAKRADPTITLYSHYTGTSGKARDVVNSADVAGNVQGTTNMLGFNWFATANATNTTVNLEAQWCADARM